MPRLAVLFCAAMFAAGAHANPVAEVEAAIRDFFTAYAGGDVASASRLWDGELPKKTALTMRVRCMRLDGLRQLPRHVGQDTALVDVEAAITSWSALETPRERQENELRTVCLRRDADGWKIAGWDRPEDVFLSRFDALDRVAQAHALRSAPRTPAMAVGLVDRAILEINRQDAVAARPLIDLAAEIAAETGDPRAIAAALEGESVYLRMPRHQNVEASARVASEGLSFATASGDADAVARVLLRLGRASHVHDATTRALFRRVLGLADRLIDVSIAARAATQLAEDANRAMRYRDEMEYSRLALLYARSSGDPVAALSAQMNLAGAYRSQGDHELSAFHSGKALVLARGLGFPNAEAAMLAQLARDAEHFGHAEEAGALRDEALALHQDRSCAHQLAASLLFERVDFLRKRGDLEGAVRDLVHAFREVEAAASAGDDEYDRGILFFAEILLQQGKAEEALAIARRQEGVVHADLVTSAALMRLGRSAEARDFLEAFVDRIESRRTNIFGTERQHAFFLELHADVYIALANVLIATGETEKAFGVIQKLKARVLREVLAEGGASGTADEPDADERRLTRAVTQLNAALVEAREPERMAALRDELARVRIELQDAISQSRVSAPRLISQGDASAPIDLRNVLERAVVIDYAVSAESTTIFALRRGPDGDARMTAHVLPVGRAGIATKVRELRTALEQRNLQYGALSRSLYELLLAPIEPEIAGAPLLCIVPNSALWQLPFHALRDPRGKYLAEKMPLIYAPSVAVLAEMMSRAAPNAGRPSTLLAFANPNIRAATVARVRAFHERAELGAIPEAENEVRSLGRLYGPDRSRIYIGDDARETVLKREAGSSDILHVASHGLIDDGAPMFSALVLSKTPGEDGDDGLLEAREISGLKPGTRITILSACDTGKGRISEGEGVIGLSRAFLANGCPTAVVSQWKAVSATTATLMVDFHRNLLRGDDAAAALQKAQLALMRDERYSHPFYWAPFVVIGAP